MNTRFTKEGRVIHHAKNIGEIHQKHENKGIKMMLFHTFIHCVQNNLHSTNSSYSKLNIMKIWCDNFADTMYGMLRDKASPNGTYNNGAHPSIRLDQGGKSLLATNSESTYWHLLRSHKLTRVKTINSSENKGEQTPQRASKRYWALSPSCPHEVPLGKNLIPPSTAVISTTSEDSPRKCKEAEKGERCFSSKARMVFIILGTRPKELRTLTNVE